MPLDDAVVLGSSIYGTMGPYVMKFSAVTGAFEASARVTTLDIRSPTRITEMDGTIWVATRYMPTQIQNPFSVPQWVLVNSGFGLFPVSTALAIGTPVDLAAINPGDYDVRPNEGPYAMTTAGGYIYFYARLPTTGGLIRRYNPTTAAGGRFAISSDANDTDLTCEMLENDGTWLYFGNDGHVNRVELSTVTDNNTPFLANEDRISVGGFSQYNYIRAVTSVGGDIAYGVNGQQSLHRASWAGGFSTFNLATLQAGVTPTRIRYNPNTARIYIPCPGHGIIIVWNPATDTGTVIGGLGSPIDVVWTADKVWAVQNSSTPLVDITP